MNEQAAQQVVNGLRERGVIARLTPAGPFRVGLRIPLGDGREALWDVDGAAGLEAQVMRNGVLVGFVPTIPGSDRFSSDQMVQAIASADYGPA
jgi:hypothetical protein